MTVRFIFPLICFYLLGSILYGQLTNVHFDNIGNEDGLSYSLVNSVIQDDQGYMWIGTQDGLNRYDGYNFKVFRPQFNENSVYHHLITSLFKDSFGRIWIQCQNKGLGYFDTYKEQFYTFLHDPEDEYSISSDAKDFGFLVSEMLFHEDKDSTLWIGTDSGLNEYRPTTNDFKQIVFENVGQSLKKPSIIAISSLGSGELIVGTSTGLLLYDSNENTAKSVVLDSVGLEYYITYVHVDEFGFIWVGTRQNGLFKLSLDTQLEVIESENFVDELKDKLSDEVAIFKIFEDKIGNIWVGGSDGLFVLKQGNHDRSDVFTKINFEGLNSVKITHVIQDSRGDIWASSSDKNGIWMIDPSSFEVQSFKHSSVDENSLGTNKVTTIFEDSRGVLWIGHERGGLSKTNLYSSQFEHISSVNPAYSQMPNNGIYAIYVDDQENLWVGAYDGLYRKNGKTGAQKAYKNEGFNFGVNFNFSDRPSGKLVGAIEKDKDGSLWFGYYDYKISKYDPIKKIFQNFQHYPGQDSVFSMWSLRDICVSIDSSVYFGGASLGLGVLLPDKEHFSFLTHDELDENSIPDDWINVLYEDSAGELWVGTMNGGLARYDKELGGFESFQYDPNDDNSISHNTVKCILEQSNSDGRRLWIGTEGGFCSFDFKSKTFKRFTTEDGLLSNNIKGILEDNEGHLWISCNGGISYFDLEAEQFTNYNKEDGLQSNEFNRGAYFKGKDGKLYFGGVNGISVFHPDSLKQNPFKPELMITEFLVNNEIVKPGENIFGSVLLEKNIGFTDKITIGPQQKVISFSFTAFHYAAPSKIKYRYKLEPFETKWNERGYQNRYINYTNIPHGNYKLMIECSGIDGAWGADSKLIDIIVVPPFWKKTWFKILLLLFLIISLYSIVYFRTKELAKQKKLLTQQVSHRTSQLEAKRLQLERTNNELKDKQEEIIQQNNKIADQRDHLEVHNKELMLQKKESTLMAKQLHESDQAKLHFFTNISHEFRTPLSLIIGPTESLLDRDDYSDTESIKESLSLMYRSEKRLLRLINQILEIRRVETGNLDYHTQNLDVVQFCQDLFALFQPLANKKGIRLEFQSKWAKFSMMFDPDKLEKILFNLLSNAAKHTPSGGGIILSLSKIRQKDTIEFCVINSGKGISPRDVEQIFDRFFHSSQKRNDGELSFGIGLSLVKDLVDFLGGFVGVEQMEKGTCFKVGLPLLELNDNVISKVKDQGFLFSKSMIEKVRENDKTRIESEFLVNDYPEGTQVILIVEDNPDMLWVLSDSLKKSFIVLSAENGEMGISMVGLHTPDLIISDVMMPIMDGIEMTKILKQNQETCDIPILLLTAKADVLSQLEGFRSGADSYLIKPFNLNVFFQKVSNILESRKRILSNTKQSLPPIPKHINIKQIDQGLIEKIIKIVDVNINNDSLSGDILAKELGMSKGSLYRKLKSYTGMTVNIFIRTYRLKIAAQILQKGNCNISEVAYSVGFVSPKYFAVCFKQLFALTPSEYMNSHRN